MLRRKRRKRRGLVEVETTKFAAREPNADPERKPQRAFKKRIVRRSEKPSRAGRSEPENGEFFVSGDGLFFMQQPKTRHRGAASDAGERGSYDRDASRRNRYESKREDEKSAAVEREKRRDRRWKPLNVAAKCCNCGGGAVSFETTFVNERRIKRLDSKEHRRDLYFYLALINASEQRVCTLLETNNN